MSLPRLLPFALFALVCGFALFTRAVPTHLETHNNNNNNNNNNKNKNVDVDASVSAAQKYSQDPVLEDAPIHARFAKAAYYPVSSAKLLTINNPECLTIADLADTNTGGNSVIYDNLQLSGRFRLFYAHKNCFTAATNPTVHYAVALTNNQASPISVTYYSPGLSSDRDGGLAWIRLFTQHESLPKVEVIQPGATFYLIRTDTGDGSGSAGEGLALSGACDFEVTNGTVRLRAFAFRVFDNVVLSQLTPMSFSTRDAQGVDEKTNYKGISSSTHVVMTGLNIEITKIDSGAIQVEYPTYSLENSAYSNPEKSSKMITNASPITDSDSVLSDIQNVLYIEEEIDPKKIFTSTRTYPALNNLGVVYSLSGFITNRESKQQTVTFTMTTPNAATIAYAQEGQRWASITTAPNTPFEYYSVTVNANSNSQFQINYVLGYPDTSKVTHQFFLCCGDESESSDSSITGGAVFLIIFFVGGAVYLAGGVAFNHFSKGLRGVEAIPNINFWRACIQYTKDGWRFTIGLCTGQKYSTPAGASETTAARPVTASYDTFAGDYPAPDASSGENPFRHQSTTE